MGLLYDDLAAWWPLLSPPAEYAEEAALFAGLFEEALGGPFQTLLELGSGGGHTASHLKRGAQLTLVDRAPAMLAVSRALNPECRHVEGDMRQLRLAERFDAVLLHDALSYLLDAGELEAAARTAHAHLRPGGAALFVPDWTRESFRDETSSGGEDGEGRSLRYLSWTHDPDPTDDEVLMEFAYLLREGCGPTRSLHDVHRCGLFARETWLSALERAGLAATARPFEHSSFADDEERELFLAIRPG